MMAAADMAFNNWDKLRKAQRDYPKANKVADSFVQKALKKSPKNPFLLAWKANLSLQLSRDAETAIRHVQQAWQQPGSNDIRLLSYLYGVVVEATRKHRRLRSISGAGDENFKVWQSTAKALAHKQDREDLWSALGKVALREECWDDFRLAVAQFTKESKEGTPPATVKKHAHRTQILALQLAAEQQQQGEGDTQKYRLWSDLARKLITLAYYAPQGDPLAFEDIRDLRFMAEIYARQNKCRELIDLWDRPPAPLQTLMATHQDDLWGMRTRLPRQNTDWTLVESQCLAYINLAISKSAQDPDSKSLWELCAWKLETWRDYMYAVEINHSKDDAQSVWSDMLKRAFGVQLQPDDRSLSLVYMGLRCRIKMPMLEDCKIYWRHHSNRIACFADVRPFITVLAWEQRLEFIDCVRMHAEENHASKVSRVSLHARIVCSDFVMPQDAQIIEQNTLKMIYCLQFSTVSDRSDRNWKQNAMEVTFRRAVMGPWSNEPDSSIGVIAIYVLLQLHRDAMFNLVAHPLGNTPNSRLLLQAAMLARHLVARDKENQDRTLALLAARLHLNLGLGKCAFQLYRLTKCKEMLLHTLSPYVLSRISLTHPFGAENFSAEEELERVIDTMHRMENKIEDTMIPDLRSITWDKTRGLVDLKQKFKSSLSKLICIAERRRVARLKGESVENLPALDSRSYEGTKDHTSDVFPNYEFYGPPSGKPLSFIMPNKLPTLDSMMNNYDNIEATSSFLYKETQELDYLVKSVNPSDVDYANTPAEERAEVLWNTINEIVKIMTWEEDRSDLLAIIVRDLPRELHAMRLAMEKLRMSGFTTSELEDEPAMFHENMLISCYTKFEILRALNKTIEHLREKVINQKSTHFMKAKLPKNWVTEVETEMKMCYEAIRDVARSYISLIEEKGAEAIKAQIRWGETGEILKKILSDHDVALYAREYVDSALQAWKGVLKVKLK
ncbi:cytoskeleton organization [Pyrenophora seminiperda CCB06]|uniref:Cytoskeleton organization n=1 Tax=Pyrenophora seminiperda CCB06 TaxID=1302712 RepID=A0A3M7MHI8_9PLEO|nr:cytoskeleton organization [Pyrenophora seminiperda CCB06]